MESPSVFVQLFEFSDIFSQPFSKLSLPQDASSSVGSPMAKVRPTDFLMRSQCQKDISNQRLGFLVNPEKHNKKGSKQDSGNRIAHDCKLRY